MSRLIDFVEQFTVLDRRWRSIGTTPSSVSTKQDLSITAQKDTKEPPNKKVRHEVGNRNALNAEEEEEDPFQCSDLAVTSVYEKVERSILPHYVKAWQDLDARKIAASYINVSPSQKGHEEENDDDDDSTVVAGTSAKRKSAAPSKRPFWFNKHVRFPENFDYMNQQSNPPPAAPASSIDGSNDNDGVQDRVISLLDPTKTMSYEHELWHLFDEIPTSHELGESLEDGIVLPHTRALHEDITNLHASSGAANKKQSPKKKPSTTGATHWNCGLYGLRMADRHGVPTALPTHDGGTSMKLQKPMDLTGAILLEFWKQPFQDQHQPLATESSRMVMEFLGSQTLLDVHRAIVDMTHDDVWDSHVNHSIDTLGQSRTQQTGESRSESNVGNSDQQRSDKGESGAGFFFIEGSFYTHGGDAKRIYVQPIQDWIVGGTEDAQKKRASYLGLAPPESSGLNAGATRIFDDFPVLPMSEVCLETIEFGFGKRCAHVHNGNVECSMFVVDFLCHRSLQPQTGTYPILHDVWTFGPAADCEACQRRVATFVTRNNCSQTQGQRFLCQGCAEQLALPAGMLQRYSVWKQNMTK